GPAGRSAAAGGLSACASRIAPLSVAVVSAAPAPNANRTSAAVIRQRDAEAIMRGSRSLTSCVEKLHRSISRALKLRFDYRHRRRAESIARCKDSNFMVSSRLRYLGDW